MRGITITLLLALWLPLASANQNSSYIETLPIDRQAVLFKQYLLASGQRCEAVSRVFHQGLGERSLAYWNIACGDDGDYVVRLSTEIDAPPQVTSCREFARSGKTCFERFAD